MNRMNWDRIVEEHQRRSIAAPAFEQVSAPSLSAPRIGSEGLIAAVHQRLLLEEQVRRDILAHALFQQQQYQQQATTAGNLLYKLGLVPNNTSKESPNAPPLKKRRVDTVNQQQFTPAAISLSAKERKASFPLPGEHCRRPIQIRSLAAFEKTWTRLSDNKLATSAQRQASAKELFSRKLAATNNCDRLNRKLHGL
jgi:hypothetical protein